MTTTTNIDSNPACFKQVDEFCTASFDFLILGGGTAGLTLAHRLSENASWKVGVLEAGQYLPDDPLIHTASAWPQLVGSQQYTWQTNTVPQKNLNNRSIYIPTGKTLGGSSSINIMMYTRAGKMDYDAWEAIGNPGWNWKELLPYFKRTEKIHPEGMTSLFEGTPADSTRNLSEFHGLDGNIQVTYNANPTELEKRTARAFNSLGVRFNSDQGSGDTSGFFVSGRSVAPVTDKRSSAVTEYLKGIASRPNLYILTEAIVTRVLFDAKSSSNSNLNATGAEFLYRDVKYKATASKEVIVSSGSFKSPQILELSGIGDKNRLTGYGIPSVLDLPGVGENFIDHNLFSVRIKLKDTSIALNPGEFSRPVPAACCLGLSDLCSPETITRLKKILDEELDTPQATPLQKAQYAILKKLIDQNIPLAEFAVIGIQPVTGPGAHSFGLVLLHPMARGSVHIGSNDPLVSPIVDPRYFDNSFDFEILKAMMQFVDKVFKSDALSDCLLEYVQPGGVESIASLRDEEYKAFLADYAHTSYHPVGTCAMVPRELGGVVDPSLKVYGTSNLRIVDASIFPLHIAGHTQSTVYAIAEKAADIIKTENM